MGYFSILACGKNHKANIDIEKVYQNLFSKINTYEENIFKCVAMNEDEFVLYAPYLGRALLETVCTAILGRIDPFRILFIDRVQNNSTFNELARTQNAILWTGDILQKDPVEKNKIWDQNKSFDNVKRALFGDYYEELFWKKAFQDILDEDISQYGNGIDFISEDFRKIPPDGFISMVRSKIGSLYSSFSKVVHGEMLSARLNEDVSTIEANIKQLFELLAFLLLVSNYIDVIQLKLEKTEIIETYKNLKVRIDEYGRS